MIDKSIKFDFDDILIVPAVNSKISSRYKDITLPDMLPLFTAPMDTVVNLYNVDEFLLNRIKVTLPRTIKNNMYVSDFLPGVFISLGFEDIDKHLDDKLRELGNYAHILIDVADGHMLKIVDYCKRIKELRPDITIMVGNIANPETYRWYAENDCVDYIRVGIGNGGGCLTTKQSGVGYPMASLIYETYQVKQELIKYNNPDLTKPWNFRRQKEEFVQIKNFPAIVADGGMKDYSDIIKALALGADFVMVGSIFNKALESCADNYFHGIKVNKDIANYLFDKGYPIKKHFRGMSTKQAQKAMGKTVFKTSEGVTRFRRVEYHLEGWVRNFEHYLRNAMSYSNAKTLEEFRGNTNICQITKSGYDRFNK